MAGTGCCWRVAKRSGVEMQEPHHVLSDLGLLAMAFVSAGAKQAGGPYARG